MRYVIGLFIGILFISLSCTSTRSTDTAVIGKEKEAFSSKTKDTVRIANDSLEYEIIIIEPGFNFWLNSIARPRGYYSQNFLENRNRILVIEYNIRVNSPLRFDPNLYPWRIDYSPGIDYGYEVNYLLYNYFIFFQRRYNQRLSGFVPRV
ncbi:hypothetical protein GWK08_10150 [Leptobacterium flavescens]|uniref:Lipoprotein n=1 Tax=Leptobacterium flavescens TaxID=472055 RepID=A0A6P0UMK2_9FLAO|nr:DUF6146 family protein [Leptobacterium flavescens]NER13802.1 hypothetical protein [Leptobacterium flavescens]